MEKPPSRKRKRALKDGTVKIYERIGVRKTIEITFADEQSKKKFDANIESAKKKSGIQSTSELFVNLVEDFVIETKDLTQNNGESNVSLEDEKTPATCDTEPDNITKCQSVNPCTPNSELNPKLFIGEEGQIRNLIDIVSKHDIKCKAILSIDSQCMNGHVLITKLVCSDNHKYTWSSSPNLADNYLVNDRVFLGYMASGMIPAQFKKFCMHANIGTETSYTMSRKITKFAAATSILSKQSMMKSLEEEKSLSGDSGIGVMTDARHASRKNSYNTDHVSLGIQSHKVIDVQHITKREDTSTQRHEAVGCKAMYKKFEETGTSVSEHVHDRNPSINKIVKDKGVKNINERWHVAKSVTKGMKTIGAGTKKTEGKVWHRELSDKTEPVRNHVFWAMDHAEGDEQELRRLIDVCILHFQNKHEKCDPKSPCRGPNYIPDWIIIKDQTAVKLLTDYLHKHVVYKSAIDFCYPRDTYYVESFNNVCLLYLSKRVHFTDKTHYEMRMDLAVLDWNENVDRATSSHYKRISVQHARRSKGKRTLKNKTFNFIHEIWKIVIEHANHAPGNHQNQEEERAHLTGDEESETGKGEEEDFDDQVLDRDEYTSEDEIDIF